jgi:hypothetical protein
MTMPPPGNRAVGKADKGRNKDSTPARQGDMPQEKIVIVSAWIAKLAQ